MFPQRMIDLARQLGDRLRQRGWTCATAESCTGGGIALSITAIPGSSDYLVGGVVAYSNRVKQATLGVSPMTLATAGAVSEDCAREMAIGARAALDADLGISSTGIAGPDGGTAHKPVGLVYIAVATPHTVEVRELRLDGDRHAVVHNAVIAALDMAVSMLGAERPEQEQEPQ